tara:strand:- start:810 stop:1091 length:282 start_codon:yes stop_codon:yes gene_type:complete
MNDNPIDEDTYIRHFSDNNDEQIYQSTEYGKCLLDFILLESEKRPDVSHEAIIYCLMINSISTLKMYGWELEDLVYGIIERYKAKTTPRQISE